MNSSINRIIYLLGIIAVIFIFFKHILPFIFQLLGFAFKAVFITVMWITIAFVIFLLIAQIINMIKK